MNRKERLKESIKRVDKKRKIKERSERRYKSKLDMFLDTLKISEIYFTLKLNH